MTGSLYLAVLLLGAANQIVGASTAASDRGEQGWPSREQVVDVPVGEGGAHLCLHFLCVVITLDLCRGSWVCLGCGGGDA